MLEKRDYLRDIKEHPGSTVRDAAKRLGATERAVAAAWARYERQGLIEASDEEPQTFSLTEKGREFLERVGEQAPVSRELSPEEHLRAAQEHLAAALPPSSSDAQVAPREPRTRAERLKALLAEASRPKEPEVSEAEPDAPEAEEIPLDVFEFYAVQLALSDVPRSVLRQRRDSLLALMDAEVAASVTTLVSLEETLAEENAAFFSPDSEKVERIQDEIADLRDELGFYVEGGADEGGEAEPGESKYFF